MNILKIKNDQGIPFNVIIKSEKPCRGCDKAVVIYDDRFHNCDKWKELGQPVSSYYTFTINEIEGRGINMQKGVPDWQLSAENVIEIQNFIEKELN